MPTITQQAVEALKNEHYITPEESLQYLTEPQNFQQLAKYLIRLAKNTGLDTSGRPLAEYLCDEVLALAPVSENKKRNIRNFFKDVLRTDEKGEPFTRKEIKRDLALKLCFVFKLDKKAAVDFLTKGCASYGFNVRDAYESACFYCILSGKPYSAVLRLMQRYEEAPFAPDTAPGQNNTQVLRNVLEDTNWETEEDFLETFLLPNKANFVGYTQTLIPTYWKLRASLCEQILQLRTDDFDSYVGIKKVKPDPLLDGLRKAIRTIEKEEPELVGCAEKCSDWSKVGSLLQEIRDRIDEKYPDFPQAENHYHRLINQAVSDSYLIEEVLLYAMPSERNPADGKKRLTSRDSVLALSSFMDSFPQKGYLGELKRTPRTLSRSEKARKIIILFFFMDYFYDLSMSSHYSVPTMMEKEGQARQQEKQDYIENQYANFYDALNNQLAACDMPPLYPAAPFDWLILKSAYSLVQFNPEVEDPIQYFNDVIELSFPPDEEE